MLLTNYQKLTVTIGILALILSLGFNYFQYIESTSKLELKFDLRDVYDWESYTDIDQKMKIRFEETDSTLYPVLFRIRYFVTLKNFGNQPLSIERFNFEEYVPKGVRHHGVSELDIENILNGTEVWSNTQKGSYIWYPTFIKKNGKPIEFPLKITQKSVEKLNMDLIIGVPKHAWEKVKDKIKINEEINLSVAEEIFEHERVPSFGWEECLDPKCLNKRASLYFMFYMVSVISDDVGLTFFLLPYHSMHYREGKGFKDRYGYWKNKPAMFKTHFATR